MLRSAPKLLAIFVLAALVLPALVEDSPSAEAKLGTSAEVKSRPLMGDDDAPAVPDSTPSAESQNLFLVYSVNNVGYIDVCGCKRKKVRQGGF